MTMAGGEEKGGGDCLVWKERPTGLAIDR